jgi:hypothetical protein
MRAREFVNEARGIGRISKTKSNATVGLNKFRDRQFADRVYEINRVMMAAACTDGVIVPDVDGESWAGRNDIAAPYTPIEQQMMKKAYQAIGSHHIDLNKGDLKSKEIPSTNTKSVVVAFKGYPR